ncbi:MAG TPA: ATP phosphoribosyltransferase [Clostridia bacterium]|jgi:ATP phosphoribosyltransferase|nr:ATP phosphoribosyltransferase [Clostridiaceae bacterium]HOF27180.1 ATP phosphoribosyltransferase [Clostridia bacterium]HOM34730.1 ATP phosphoribosyltransferase [Clostridia bacterium]HOR89297.1 ATP phosphoribosyltransferase [Clostridia bacterium]HOT70267.1 ATP phosphoribosyltransferase [Clostridia bacterium]
MEYLKIALPKGRLAVQTVELFKKAGIPCTDIDDDSRKLIHTDQSNKIKIFLVKAADVPVYVEYGAADMGVAGKDTLMEESKNVYDVLNLGFGACRMCVAGEGKYLNRTDKIMNKRVATKYPKIASEYYRNVKNENVEIIKLNGSVELAPLCNLSELIVDIVESGKTLQANGLVVLEKICDISAHLIVNKVSMNMKTDKISYIISALKKELSNDSDI